MKLCAGFIVLLITSVCSGQPFGEVKGFSAVNVVDDATVSLSEYQDKPGVVIIFRGNECAFDGYYAQRIGELVKLYNDKIPFILVNPYIEPAEAPDKMKMYAAVWGLNVPYLADKDQAIMKLLGAKKTPEAFLLKSGTGKFTIIYEGAIDDNPQLPAGVTQKHLQLAVENLLNSKTQATTKVRAAGCTIRTK